jgi:hypothetical protein
MHQVNRSIYGLVLAIKTLILHLFQLSIFTPHFYGHITGKAGIPPFSKAPTSFNSIFGAGMGIIRGRAARLRFYDHIYPHPYRYFWRKRKL